MKMLLTLALLGLLLAAAVVDVEACGRRRRRRRGGSSRLVITPRNPPLRNPPTPNPTPPPPPPPIPTGWVPPPPRAPAQEMTRTNCEARVEFTILTEEGSTTSVNDRRQIQEQWIYECTFQVYVEVDVAETAKPTNCACGVTYARQHPPNDPNYNKAFSTEITKFSMVAFDVVRNVVVGVFPPETFDQLKPTANTTAMLENSAASNSQNYELTAKGYSGLIQSLSKDKFPSALQSGSADFTLNNVPAMCFTVKEKYVSSYKWPEPPRPALFTTPNVWVSQCYPFYDYPGASAKRQATPEVVPGHEAQRYWFKEFLLFPMDKSASASGFVPRNRYITSWYVNSNCQQAAGVVSFDREFESQLDRDRVFYIHGAFAWTRTYTSMHIVGGVPKAFGSALSFYRLGYTKITWNQVYGTDGSGNFRAGVVYHALLGLTRNAAGQVPFVGATERTKLCTKLPDAWASCQPGAGCAELRTDEYNEGAFSFKAPLTADDTFNCYPAVRQCAKETTFLSFQNFGSYARDYSKRRDSVLLTGPRSAFCFDYPPVPTFDTLYFQPYKAGAMQIRKRAVEQAADAPERKLRFDKDGNVIAQPESTDVPKAQDIVVQPAAGSADAFGNPGGDHPIALFPEQYTVPVTLNPQDTSYDGAIGAIFDGKLAPCLEGSRGCTCRDNPNRPPCDAPLDCNEQKFCEPPTCVPGAPGCACLAGNTCADGSYATCEAGSCVFAPTCAPGANGCLCTAEQTCTDGAAVCSVDGVCVLDEGCAEGASGCACAADGSCTSPADKCDELENICMAPVCEPGAAGCKCAENEQCRSGFSCTNDKCVQSQCPAGQPGCACGASSSCDIEGFECKAFRTDGSDNRCVAEGKNCGDQTERCVKFCGIGRVLKCPACSNQLPLCAGAASLVPSVLVALALAALALLF